MNCPRATRKISRNTISGKKKKEIQYLGWENEWGEVGEEFSEDVAPQMAGNWQNENTLLTAWDSLKAKSKMIIAKKLAKELTSKNLNRFNFYKNYEKSQYRK